MKCLLVLFLFYFSLNSFSKEITPKDTSIVLRHPQINNNHDSVVISLQQFDKLAKLLKKDDTSSKDFTPSIMAFLTVLISTAGALLVGSWQINNQNKRGQEQLRSQEAQSQENIRVSREQIKESTNIALKQINSNNRQNWIIETRNTITELTAQVNLMNIEFQEKIINLERQKEIHVKITFNKNKLILLLKPDLESHKKLRDSLYELINILDLHLRNSRNNNDPNSKVGFIAYDNGDFMEKTNTVLENGRILLYEEWGKIQD